MDLFDIHQKRSDWGQDASRCSFGLDIEGDEGILLPWIGDLFGNGRDTLLKSEGIGRLTLDGQLSDQRSTLFFKDGIQVVLDRE